MAPIFIGAVLAMLFGISSVVIFGMEGMMTKAWIDQVFWALIGTGVVISAINAVWECLPCKLTKLVHAKQLSGWICEDTPCAK